MAHSNTRHVDRGIDRSRIHLGLQVAFNMYEQGVKDWPKEVYDIDFSEIDTEDSQCHQSLKEHLGPGVFQLLEQLGDQCARHGVASSIREVNQRIGSLYVSLLPQLQLDWSLRDGTVRFGDSTTIVTQGANTCALDVLIFLGWGLKLGTQRRDIERIDSWTFLPKAAVAYRTLMARIRLQHIDPSAKNDLRDVTMQALSEWDQQTHELGELQSVHGVADLCWKGMRSLSYTTIDVLRCCDNYIIPPNLKSRRRMGHNIFLFRNGQDTYPNTSLVEIIRQTFLRVSTSSDGDRDSSGNMKTPFVACKGREDDCLQLPTLHRIIADEPPALFYVSLGEGYPTKNSNCRAWDRDLRLQVFRWRSGSTVSLTWKVVGMVFHYGGVNGTMHFVSQVAQPPKMKGYRSKPILHFDGGNLTGVSRFATGLRSKADARVVMVLYRMTDESVRRCAA